MNKLKAEPNIKGIYHIRLKPETPSTTGVMTMKKDIFDITTELQGISAQLTAIRYAFEENEGSSLTNQTMCRMLFAFADHIDRIVNDLDELDSIESKERN